MGHGRVGRPPKALFTCIQCRNETPASRFKPGAQKCFTCWVNSGDQANYLQQRDTQQSMNDLRTMHHISEQLPGHILDFERARKLREADRAAAAIWSASFCVCCLEKNQETPDASGHTFCRACQTMKRTGVCEFHMKTLD